MSLQLAAQHMASRGRGPDTQLVHMAPQEVAGLQALAKAHGGSLTTNPDTGLPEAGFLSSILPMVAGAFLGPAGLGLSAIQSGLAAGALGTIATGSLKKGLMAGLGAYGGAGLAGSIMGSGTGAISAGTGADVAAAAGNTGLIPAAQVAPAVQMAPAVQGVQVGAPIIDSANLSQTGANLFGPSVPTPNLSNATSGYEVGMPIKAANMVPTVTPAPMSDPTIVSEATQERLLADRLAKATPMDKAKAGLSAVMDKPDLLFNKNNIKYFGAAAAPFLFQEPEQKARKEEKPYEYGFNYNRVANPNAGYTGPATGERTYFNPVYTRTAADGGLMDSGPVQSMSDQNQAEMLMINRGQRFDEGGAVGKVEDNPYYTMTGQSGDAFKYLMGQGPRVAAAPAAAPAAGSTSVATPASLASSVGLDNSYAFNPATGTFASIGEVVRNTAPATSAQYYSGGDSANTGVTPQQAAVFDFMNTPAGAQYKEAFGAANSRAIGSLMPGSIITGALKGQFDDPITALRDAHNVFTAAEQAARADRISNLPTGYENVGGGSTYSGSGPSGFGSDYGDTSMGGSSSFDSAYGYAQGGIAALARGGQSHLGDYSDGGRLLRGPGDGVSDSIPATIGNKRPARLADGEFVVPARIVSELGNGSTEAGARKLYAMMDRVQKARKKSIGKNRVAVNSKTDKLLPA